MSVHEYEYKSHWQLRVNELLAVVSGYTLNVMSTSVSLLYITVQELR